jgi:ABC-type transport system substrate-binding protein
VTVTRLRTLRVVAAVAAFLLTAVVVALAQQPPKQDEKEDPKGGVKKKIIDPDDDPGPKPGPKAPPGPGTPPEVRLDEVARAADAATHPALKAFLTRYSIPFDQVTEKRGLVVRIKPIPPCWKDGFPADAAVPVVEIRPDGQPGQQREIAVKDIAKIDHFEELAVSESDKLLKQKPLGADPGPDGLTAPDQLAAAEKVLAAARRFHDYARENNHRRGKGWDPIRKSLVERLREVRLRQLRVATTANDWPRMEEFGKKLLDEYQQDPDVAREVATAWIGRAVALAASDKEEDWLEARRLLDLVEGRFPGAGGEPARKVRDQLRKAAEELAGKGEDALSASNIPLARDYAERSYAIDPSAAAVADLRRKLNISPSLYVAVRPFPTRLDPLNARLDGERQAVELLFEGLLEEVPDPGSGTRYRPGAALGPAAVVPGGRRLALRLVPRGPGGRDGLDAHDVIGTLNLIRRRPDTWAAAGLPWLTDQPVPDGGAVRINFRHGHPDPRALLTFKILPANWLRDQKEGMNDPGYLAQPFGTGPYRIANVFQPGGGRPRELVLVANRTYEAGSRDRKGQPFITEVRMVEALPAYDPVAEFLAGRLHLLPDPTPDELKRITNPATGLNNRVKVVTAAVNRRVHVLAVNHRRPPLRNPDFRLGLAKAISREAVLAELDRRFPELKDYRKLTAPMSGPFPPKCWATPRGPGGQPIPLSNPDEGHNLLRRYLGAPGATSELSLLYPAEDPRARVACEAMREQIEALFKTDTDGRKLTLTPVAVPSATLALRVMDEHDYDLAYVPFDYPDDWYPFGLAALLDPQAGGRGGRNFVGFRVPGTTPDEHEIKLGQVLEELRGHGDFAGAIAPKAVDVHRRFVDDAGPTMPFIPLWQLDRYVVVSNRLKIAVDDSGWSDPSVLNPTVLFHNVGRWRLE